ncbi:hypothetical protein STENM327S_07314 [Streptomyces tendae]
MAAAITELIGQAPAGYRHVVATRDHHVAPGGHFADNPDYVHSWPAHCVAGTEGVGFHPNFAPAVASGARDAVFDKGAYAAAYSGFEGADENGTGLAEWLRFREIDEVDVVGIATDHRRPGHRPGRRPRGLPYAGAARPDRRGGRGDHRAGTGGAAAGRAWSCPASRSCSSAPGARLRPGRPGV